MHVETRLLEACIREDRLAQSELYRRCYSVLMGVCRRYIHDPDEAVSVLNAGFLKILSNLRKKRPEVPFEVWSKKIMINTVIDNFRRERRHRETMVAMESFPDNTTSAPTDLNEAAQRLDAEAIEAAIRTLPPVSREVFNLFAIDGYAHSEIAQMLGMSEGTSKWHVNFARTRLRNLLAHWLEEDRCKV
ncbi:MAG: RNA polymerase sigma factor [Bacteroidia bacterium]|nr:RNA polymerase sigma factor [Bacteroidia bacterium]